MLFQRRCRRVESQTAQAYRAYFEAAKAAFLARVPGTSATELKDGVVVARPAKEDGIIKVPGGLIHHWTATVFFSGVSVQKAVDVSQAYSRYPLVYQSVAASSVLGHDGDTFHVLMRLKERQAGLTVVLQVRSTVVYQHLSDILVCTLSNADEIREVEDPDGAHERLLPAGQDRGYLWRANVLTSFLEQNGGVIVQTETLGLSRTFPYMLGWILEPIARRLGRKSVETSLQEFYRAIRLPPPAPASSK